MTLKLTVVFDTTLLTLDEAMESECCDIGSLLTQPC